VKVFPVFNTSLQVKVAYSNFYLSTVARYFYFVTVGLQHCSSISNLTMLSSVHWSYSTTLPTAVFHSRLIQPDQA